MMMKKRTQNKSSKAKTKSKQDVGSATKFDCGKLGTVNIYNYGEKVKRKVLVSTPKQQEICLTCGNSNCQRISQLELAQQLRGCHCQMITEKFKPNLKRTDSTYGKHMFMMEHVEVLIDNKAPKLDADHILKSKKLLLDLARTKEILKDNMKLLRKINIIQQSTGWTDTYNPLAGIRAVIRDPILEKKRLKRLDKWNRKFYERIVKTQPYTSKKEHDEHWKKASARIKYRARYPICIPGFDKNPNDLLEREPSILSFFAISHIKVSLQFSGCERVIGSITCAVFKDLVPKTCYKFYKYCGINLKGNEELYTYIGTSVSRIFPGLYFEMGDIDFGCECPQPEKSDNFLSNPIDCNYRGTMIMKNKKTDAIDSSFMITFKPIQSMNGKWDIFGRVISGSNTLITIENLGSPSGKTCENIYISKIIIIPAKPNGPMCISAK